MICSLPTPLLLSGIKLSDLCCVASFEEPDRIVSPVQSIIEQQHNPEAPEDPGDEKSGEREGAPGDEE